MRTSAAPVLTPEEQATITAALPSIRQAAPDAANIIVRLLDACGRPGDGARAPVRVDRRDRDSLRRHPADDPQLGRPRLASVRSHARGHAPGSRDQCWPSPQALSRPRPAPPDLSRSQIEAILNAPRRSR